MRRVIAKQAGRRVCAAPGGLIPKKKVGWGDRWWGEVRDGPRWRRPPQKGGEKKGAGSLSGRETARRPESEVEKRGQAASQGKPGNILLDKRACPVLI